MEEIILQKEKNKNTFNSITLNPKEGTQDNVDLLEKEEKKSKKPKLYCVVMLNDDYTPMDFVIWIIQKVFLLPTSEATRLMLDVHNKGSSRIGIFTYDVARSKMERVHELSEQYEHPLKCRLEVVETD